GTTYGGQPFAAAAAAAVLRIMERDALPDRAETVGCRLRARLEAVPAVTAVRGRGLLLAVELEAGRDARVVQAELLRRGLVTNAVTPTAIRLAPPLTVSEDELEEAVALIAEVLA
ncbi:MAG TPA: aminotransferase class III-fold pyridoxal phosphate-dependent enzyme, partial [Acidimicrobiales bacterium]|nr:aminotransferase class III-fold pyridoxal phosphate-dependent enzyme [Acidimicrobiales bacterium]